MTVNLIPVIVAIVWTELQEPTYIATIMPEIRKIEGLFSTLFSASDIFHIQCTTYCSAAATAAAEPKTTKTGPIPGGVRTFGRWRDRR